MRSPIQEREGNHRSRKVDEDEREEVGREDAKQNPMQGSSVPVTTEPQSDRRVNCTPGELSKKVAIVTIHQCNSNHRSQNQEKKPQTYHRYTDVCQFSNLNQDVSAEKRL